MLIGKYYHTLEHKGRLAIPATFRKTLGSKILLTRGLDGCLFLLPQETWGKITLDLRGSPLTKQDTRRFIRLMAHDAAYVKYDPQGRILIPQVLKDIAKLKNKVVIAGSLDWVEIWDQDLYHQKLDKDQDQAELVAERLSKTYE